MNNYARKFIWHRQFLEKYSLIKLSEEENRKSELSLTLKEIEFIISSLSTRNITGLYYLLANSIKNLLMSQVGTGNQVLSDCKQWMELHMQRVYNRKRESRLIKH